jgi:methylthioribose-1-phosphate isomerase
VKVRNPAFDVTPARYITGIITEKGVVRGDYEQELKKLVGQ